MHRIHAIGAIVAAGLLAGCATSPEQLDRMSTTEVCRGYGAFKSSPLSAERAQQYAAELRRRAALSEKEWGLVSDRRIGMGMSRCALYASWGVPSRENRTVGAWGERIQHVYNAGLRYVKPTYVYTHNGAVVSWQD